MNEWKELLLGELISYKKGYAFKSKDLSPHYDIPVVKLTNTKGKRIDISSCDKVTSQLATTLREYALEVNDVIIATVGSWPSNPASVVGKIIKVDKTAAGSLLNQNAVKLKATGKITQSFLTYTLSDLNFQNYIVNRAQGSANQASITLKDIFAYKVRVPPLSEQIAIAEALSSLDDKIDLLHRNNKTMEAIAETLFRQWFVEKGDVSWAEGLLGDFIESVSGYSYRSVDLQPSENALVTLKSFDRNGGFKQDGFKEYTGKYKDDQVVVNGDLVVAHTDLTQDAEVLGNPAIVISTNRYKKLIISTDLVKVVPNSYLSKPYLYFMMKGDDFKHYCLGASNGTTVLHLSKAAVPNYEFKLPPEDLVRKFTDAVEPMLDKLTQNQIHIAKLEQLRDGLLPRLMNGSVKVNELVEA